MKTLQELLALKHQRAERVKALTGIMEGANGITARDLTDAEQNEITEIRNGADALETQIRNAQFIADQKAADAARQFEARGRMAGAPMGDSEERDQNKVAARYSITRALQYAADKNVDAAVEREMHQEALAEARASNLPITGNGVLVPGFVSRATAATAADAGNLIPTNQMATIEGYKPQLYVEQLGATMHTGLVGINNIPVADMTAVSAFVGEGAAFTDVAATVRRPQAVAKGLMSKLTNSWFLKAQAGTESDRILLQTLSRASENALNSNIIKRANINSSHGLFGAADVVDVSGTDGSAIARDVLITMINTAAKNNAGGDKAGWLVSPDVRESLQKLKTDTGSGLFVWADSSPNQLLGYQAAVTTLMPSNLTKGTGTNLKGAAFGYWENLHLFNWAVKEIIADTASNDAGVVFKQLEFWDWVWANPKAFALSYFI